MKKQNKQAHYDEYSYDNVPIRVSGRPRAVVYEADLHGYIENPSQFSQIISAMNSMDEDDLFILNIQSGGGSLDVADSLIHAIRKCSGSIHAVCTGNVSSAATFILLESDSFELSEGFNAVCHSGSLGSGGTYSEYRQQTAFYNKFMENTLRRMYVGMFTPEELDAMLDGRDFILDAQEWAERYEKRNEYFQSLQDDEPCGNGCEDCSCKDNEQMSVEEIKEEIKEEITGDEAYDTIKFQMLSEKEPREIRVPKKRKIHTLQPAPTE